MLRKQQKSLLFSLLFGVVLLNSSPLSTWAQEGSPGPSLQISPVLFEEEMELGAVKTETITLTNNSTETVAIVSEVADFYYDASGSMKFIEESEENPSVASLKKWLTYDLKDFQLGPNESRKLDFTIAVPANAESGGHYGVMFFRTQPPGGGTVAVSARIGALVLVTVPGDVRRTGTVSDFKVGVTDEQNDQLQEEKTFFQTGPVSFAFSVENMGNAHFKPQGSILIKDMFGKVVEEVAAKDTRSFPGIPRRYVQSAKLDPWGKYEATLNFKDGDGKPMQALTVGFWGFNYLLVLQWLVLILVVLAILILGIKQYNKWIIAQARKHHGGHQK